MSSGRSVTGFLRRRAPAAPGATRAAEEAEWLRQVAEGDRGTPFARLYERHAASVHALGMRVLGERGLAEELVQETFVRLWRAAPAFDPGRGTVAAFLFTIARNVAIGLWRRPSSRPLEEQGPDPRDDGGMERLVAGLTVRDALRGLSEDHRRVIELCFDEDLTQVQAAERLGVPVGTVKSRSHHALAALRRALAPPDEGARP
jgi:RNA polymerase sigma-70 factor, ECF subfamily